MVKPEDREAGKRRISRRLGDSKRVTLVDQRPNPLAVLRGADQPPLDRSTPVLDACLPDESDLNRI
jgi:hypothetical protein